MATSPRPAYLARVEQGLIQSITSNAIGVNPRSKTRILTAPWLRRNRRARLALSAGSGYREGSRFSRTKPLPATHTDRVPFAAASAQEYMDIQRRDHPLSIAGQAVLESRGGGEEIAKKGLAILERATEDPRGFRVTSQYVVATAVRRP